jgi:hypothetical protein
VIHKEKEEWCQVRLLVQVISGRERSVRLQLIELVGEAAGDLGIGTNNFEN